MRYWLLGMICALAVVGCSYGFAGGGLPPHIRTVAVVPFDNQTPSTEVSAELLDRLRDGLRGRLGVREANEAAASAIVRGTIVRYEPDIPIGFSANNQVAVAAQRQVEVVIDIEIVDQTTGRTLWARRALSARGTYLEQREAQGRREAIDKIVQDIVDGAQSQW
ncbi:MAG: DUF4136 domain-containing protein [Gemmatimonadaceae bacterium]|nr:DUF4136 domain-containing protein [Gemmatimonadaceae bacterium]